MDLSLSFQFLVPDGQLCNSWYLWNGFMLRFPETCIYTIQQPLANTMPPDSLTSRAVIAWLNFTEYSHLTLL